MSLATCQYLFVGLFQEFFPSLNSKWHQRASEERMGQAQESVLGKAHRTLLGSSALGVLLGFFLGDRNLTCKAGLSPVTWPRISILGFLGIFCLKQWFSTGGIFVSQETSGNVWRHLGCHTRKQGCHWHLVTRAPGVLCNDLWYTGQPLQRGLTWTKVPIVPRLRNFFFPRRNCLKGNCNRK